MKEIQCIFCGIPSENTVIVENGFQGRKCPQCGLIYISPRPSFEEIINLYGHNDAYLSAEAHISAGFIKRLYARHHLAVLRSFVTQGTLLEIGAGAGHFLDEARKAGFQPYGLELNPIQAEHIKTTLGIPCECSPLSSSPFGGRRFDIIYHCDVISHFYDPFADFKALNGLLNSRGFLVFETGNGGDIDPRYYRYFDRFHYPDHLFFFSTRNLQTLLESSGFELLTMRRYSILPQLRLIRALARRGNSPRERTLPPPSREPTPSPDRSSKTESATGTPPPSTATPLRTAMRNSYHYLNYLLRYQIGGIMPKGRRPQTLIIVARKK